MVINILVVVYRQVSFITFVILMTGKKEIVMSGIRPTGFLHLGIILEQSGTM
jgi:hypothetical protein